MTDLFTRLTAYSETHTSDPSPLLRELERETHLTTLAPQMLSGHLQGRLLSLLSRLLRPRLALEIGTFTGYSALCLAEGLANGGLLHTIEIDPEREQLIRKYVDRAGLEDRIRLHIGDARAVIPELTGEFDLVFIDAGKQDYALFFDLVIDRVRPGGLLLADNVLWSGKVLDDDPADEDAQYIKAFNEKALNDTRVETLMLPVRDGLLVCRRLAD